MADFKSDPEVMAQLQEVREAAQKVAQIKLRISHRDWGGGVVCDHGGCLCESERNPVPRRRQHEQNSTAQRRQLPPVSVRKRRTPLSAVLPPR